MRSILRHGKTVPTTKDLANHQIGFCDDDNKLYIRKDNEIVKIDNAVIDEHSFAYTSNGTNKLNEKALMINSNLSLTVEPSFSDNKNKITFKVTNSTNEEIVVSYKYIFNVTDFSAANTPSLVSNSSEDFAVTVPAASFAAITLPSTSGYSVSYRGLLKIDAANFDLTLNMKHTSTADDFILYGSVSYGSVE